MRMSDHLRMEIAAASTRGRTLDPGEAVPGCACPTCTGLPEDHPARARKARQGSGPLERLVEDARTLAVLDVARSLGLEPRKAGKEYVLRCPFHGDRTPSLYLNPEKGLWHCFSCGRGGDGIRLVMEVRRMDFADAVKEMAEG